MGNERQLNRVIQEIKPSQVTVLTSAPTIGKTALALNIATQYAIHEEKVVAFFSIEVLREFLIRFILSASEKISIQKMWTGNFSQEEWEKILSAFATLHNSNLVIDDSIFLSEQDIIQKCIDVKNRFGKLDLVIVDYLNLLFSQKAKGDGTVREEVLEERIDILNELNDFAKQFDIPILVLAQLSRADHMRNKRMPANEANADHTLTLYSGFQGNWLFLRRVKDSEDADILCVQGENVGTCIPLKFNSEFLSFSEK